jgi:hypothetical protein
MGIETYCHANGTEPDCESRLAGRLVGFGRRRDLPGEGLSVIAGWAIRPVRAPGDWGLSVSS